MREVACVSSKKIADRLVYYLCYYKIEAIQKSNDDDNFYIWIIHEKDMNEGKKLVTEFLRNPEDVSFEELSIKGELLYRKLIEPVNTTKINFKKIGVDNRSNVLNKAMGNTTLLLIFITSFFYLLDFFNFPFYQPTAFYFSENILSGQFWRLLTPVFLHRDFFHFLFNVMWLFELSNMIENDKGRKYTLFLFLSIAILCNIIQYFITGPNFLGMSGVIYGFFGYIWMQIRFGTSSVYIFNSFNIGFLLIWFALCLTGIVGHVANTHHGVGLCLGMLTGFWASGYHKRNNILKNLTLEKLAIASIPFCFLLLGILGDKNFYGFFNWLYNLLKQMI